jgi:hypothetical protein
MSQYRKIVLIDGGAKIQLRKPTDGFLTHSTAKL